MQLTPLIVIVGSTASGKSALAIQLALQFNGEIISADSRTIYRGMDIGTAKPSKADQKAVPHHLLDIRGLDQKFTVADFKREAEAAINQVGGQGRLPIMVGGTGLYIDSVLFDYQFSGPSAERDELNPRHLKAGINASANRKWRSNTLVIGLEVPREELKKRIENRVRKMWTSGLPREVECLVKDYGWNDCLLQTIGYKELVEYFAGTLSADQTQDLIIKNTIDYAKRQQTWFSRYKSIHWVSEQIDTVELTTTFLNTLQ